MRLPVLLATVALTAVCSRADVVPSSRELTVGPDFGIGTPSFPVKEPEKRVEVSPLSATFKSYPPPPLCPQCEEKRPIEYLPPWMAEAILDQVDVFDQNSMEFAAEALLTLLVGSVGVRGVRRHRRTVRRRRAVA